MSKRAVGLGAGAIILLVLLVLAIGFAQIAFIAWVLTLITALHFWVAFAVVFAAQLLLGCVGSSGRAS